MYRYTKNKRSNKTFLQLLMLIASVAMLLPVTVTSNVAYAASSFTITQDEINPQTSQISHMQTASFNGGTISRQSAPSWPSHTFYKAYIVDSSNSNKKIEITKAELKGNNVVVTPIEDYANPEGVTLQYPKNSATHIHFEYYSDAIAIPISYENAHPDKLTIDGPSYSATSPQKFHVVVSSPRSEDPTLMASDPSNNHVNPVIVKDISSESRTAYVFEVSITKAAKLIVGSVPKGQVHLTDSNSHSNDWDEGTTKSPDNKEWDFAEPQYKFFSNVDDFQRGTDVEYYLYHDRPTQGNLAYSTVLSVVYINGQPIAAPQPLARYGESKYSQLDAQNDYFKGNRPYYNKGGQFKSKNPSYVVGSYSQAQGWDPYWHGYPHDSTTIAWWNQQIKAKVIGQETTQHFTTGPLAGATVIIRIEDARPAFLCDSLGLGTGSHIICRSNGWGGYGWGQWNSLRFKYHVIIKNAPTNLKVGDEWATTRNLKVGLYLNYGVENVQVQAAKLGYNAKPPRQKLGPQDWQTVSNQEGQNWIDGFSLEGSGIGQVNKNFDKNPIHFTSVDNADPQLHIRGEVKNGYKNPVYIDGSHSPLQAGDPAAPLSTDTNGFSGQYPLFASGADAVYSGRDDRALFGGMSIVGVRAERLQVPLGFDLNGGSVAQKDMSKFPRLETIGNKVIEYLLDPEVHQAARVPLTAPSKGGKSLKDWKLQYTGADTGTSFKDTGKVFLPGSLINVYDENVVGMRVSDKGGHQKVTAFKLVAEYADGAGDSNSDMYSFTITYNDHGMTTQEPVVQFHAVKGVNVALDASKLPKTMVRNGKTYYRQIQDSQLSNQLTATVGDSAVVKTYNYTSSTLADMHDPHAQLIIVNLNSHPSNTEAKQGIQNADSLGARSFEFVGSVDTSKPTNKLMPQPTIKITYTDGSVDMVQALVKVVDNRTEAEKWKEDTNHGKELTAQIQTFDYMHTVTDSDKKSLIKEGSSLPPNATISLDSPIDTSPRDTQHYKQPYTLTVHFSDDSTLTVQVVPRIKSAANTFNPSAKSPVTVKHGAQLTNGDAQNAVDTTGLPSGTSYSFDPSHTPDTQKSGMQSGKVKVTYPDTSVDEVSVQVNVQNAPNVTGVPQNALPGSTFTPTVHDTNSSQRYTVKLCAASDASCAHPLAMQTVSGSQSFTPITIPKDSQGSVTVQATDETSKKLPLDHNTISLTPVELVSTSGSALASSVQAGSTIDAKVKNPAVGQDYVVKLCKKTDTTCKSPVATTTSTINTSSPNVTGLTIPLNTDPKAAQDGMYAVKLYPKECATTADGGTSGSITCNPRVSRDVTATVGKADLNDKEHNNFAVTQTRSTHIANGSDSYTVTITLKDNLGNAIMGKASNLHVTQSGIERGVSIGNVTELRGQKGVYTVTITSTKAGNGTITVTLMEKAEKKTVLLGMGKSNAVNFVAGPPSNVLFSGVPNHVTSGQTYCTGNACTITVTDAHGNPVANNTKVFVKLPGDDSVHEVTVGNNGVASLPSFMPKKVADNKVVVYNPKSGASAGAGFTADMTNSGKLGETVINVTAGEPDSIQSTLTLSPQSPISGSQVLIKGSLKDSYGNPVISRKVTLKLPDGSSLSATTSPQGELTPQAPSTVLQFTAGFPSIEQTVELHLGSNTSSPALKTAHVTPVVDPAKAGVPVVNGNSRSTAEIDNGEKLADNMAAHKVTVTLKDVYGSPVTGAAAKLSLATSSTEFNTALHFGKFSEVPSMQGVYEAQVTSTKPGMPVLNVAYKRGETGKELIINSSLVANFVVGPYDVHHSTLVVSKDGSTLDASHPATAGDTVHVVFTPKDAQDHVLPNLSGPVTVAVPGIANPVTLTRQSDGTFAGDVKLTQAGNNTITSQVVTSNGKQPVAGPQSTVKVVPSNPATKTSTLTLTPQKPTKPNGNVPIEHTKVNLSGVVKDAQQNIIPEHNLTVVVTNPDGSKVAIAAKTDEQGNIVDRTTGKTIAVTVGEAGEQTQVEVYDGDVNPSSIAQSVKPIRSATVTAGKDPAKIGVPVFEGRYAAVAEVTSGSRLADGQKAHVITVHLKDKYGEPVTNAQGALTTTKVDGIVVSIGAFLPKSGELGAYVAKVKSTVVGKAHVTVHYTRSGKTVAVEPQKLQVWFTVGPFDANATDIVVSKTGSTDAAHTVVAGQGVHISVTPKDTQGHVRTIPGDPKIITVNVPGVADPVVLTKDASGRYVGKAVPVKATKDDDNQLTFPSNSPLNSRTYELNVLPSAPSGANTEVTFTPANPAPSEETHVRVVVHDSYGNVVKPGTKVTIKVPNAQTTIVGVTDKQGVVHTLDDSGMPSDVLPSFVPLHEGKDSVVITTGSKETALKNTVVVVRPHMPINLVSSGSVLTGDVNEETPVNSTVTVRNNKGEIIGVGKVEETQVNAENPSDPVVTKKHFAITYNEGKQPADNDKVSVTVTDANTGVDSYPAFAMVDAKVPDAPKDVAVSIDGTTISGKGEAGAKVSVVLPDGTVLTGTVDSDGNFTVTVPRGHEVADKAKVTVVLTDNAGNESKPAVAVADRSNSLTDLAVDKSGTLVSGKTDPNSKVTVRNVQGQIIGTGVANADGIFRVRVTKLVPGAKLTIVAVDPLGNTAQAHVKYVVQQTRTQLSNTGSSVAPMLVSLVLLSVVGISLTISKRRLS